MSDIKTYRKKPVEIQAVQWDGDNADRMAAWMGRANFVTGETVGRLAGKNFTAMIWVEANSDWLRIETSEWVIKDSKGFYPCKPDIFAATYEEVCQRCDTDNHRCPGCGEPMAHGRGACEACQDIPVS